MKLLKALVVLTLFILIAALTYEEIESENNNNVDYRAIAFQQNELIIAYEEKVEELATVIAFTSPTYSSDYSDIDSLNNILDSLYVTEIDEQ